MTYIPEPEYKISRYFRRILVPVDGSQHSLRALEIAIDFAQRYGSRVTALLVIPKGCACGIDKIEELVRKRGEQVGIVVQFKVREYDPLKSSTAREIVKEAYEGSYDIIILGARGSTPEEEPEIGSVAVAVTISAPCTVMVVR